MGYVELANEKLKTQVEQFTQATASKMSLKVPAVPKVPTIPGLELPGLPPMPTVLSCVPSLESIAAVLPPIPANLTPESILKDQILPALPDFPDLPALPKLPSLDSLKKMIPNIPGLPDITLTDSEQALLDKIKGVLPGIPGIADIPQPPTLEALKTLVANGMQAGQSALDAVTLADLIPIITSRAGSLLTPPEPYTLANVQTYAKMLLPELPSLPPIPPIPGLDTIKTLCTPPVEAPSANVLVPSTDVSQNEMNKNGVNLKAQVAILGEEQRQTKVEDWLTRLNRTAQVASIQAKGEEFRTTIKTLTDVSTHPQTESDWKAIFVQARTQIDAFIDLIIAEVNYMEVFKSECIDSTTHLFFPNLDVHGKRFRKIWYDTNDSVLEIYRVLYHPIIDDINYIINKVGYAVWELYGTDFSIEKFAKNVYENMSVSVSANVPVPDDKYNFTVDYLTSISRIIGIRYQYTIDLLNKSLPIKG